MRRTSTAAATLAALLLALAPLAPAQAHEQTEAEVAIEEPGAGPHSGDVLARIRANNPDNTGDFYRIASYSIGLADGGTLCARQWNIQEEEAPTRQLAVALTWDTTLAPGEDGVRCDEWDAENGSQGETAEPVVPEGGEALRNGTYTLEAAVTYVNQVDPGHRHPVTSTKAVTIENPVDPPSGVELVHDESDEEVTVAWTGVSDVNLEGYRVQRCYVERSSKPCGDSWKTIAQVTEPHHTSSATRPGVYRYRVASIWSGADGSSRLSADAQPQSDPTEVLVEEQPEETTTTTTEPDEEQAAPESTTTTQPRPVVLPRRVERSAPQVVQRVTEEDPGYDEELPYGESAGDGAGDGGGDGSDGTGDEAAISGRSLAGSEGDDERGVLVPVAGGLAILTFAGQLWYLNRRAGESLEPIPVDDGR